MIEGGVLVQDLELMIHGWQFISVDAMGRSCGLIVGWKSCNFLFLNAWALKAGLCAVLFDYDLQKEISFVNLYAPYLDRDSLIAFTSLWIYHQHILRFIFLCIWMYNVLIHLNMLMLVDPLYP